MEEKKQLSIFCESCSVDLPYPPIALAHFWGQKHRKKCIKIGEKPAIFIPAAGFLKLKLFLTLRKSEKIFFITIYFVFLTDCRKVELLDIIVHFAKIAPIRNVLFIKRRFNSKTTEEISAKDLNGTKIAFENE